MWKYGVLILCLSGYCLAGPVGVKKRNISIGQQKANDDAASSQELNSDDMPLMSTLTLPSNATSIRADITDNFSCDNKAYGYYADVDNDCQIFHVCLPVTYADGKENTFRWSFICPEETIFSQESFTCMRPEDMVISCEESFKYYDLNSNFGNVEQESEKEPNDVTSMENNKPNMAAESEPEESVAIPVKVVKPNRRKPGAAQKKPSNTYPLRKVPQAQSNINSNTDGQIHNLNESVKPIQEEDKEELTKEEEIKPVVHKFSRRPVASPTVNSFKDKLPNAKPETVNAIRSDLYNQKRKRPTMFNKKPDEETVVVKVHDEPAKEVKPVEAEIPEQSFIEMAAQPAKDVFSNAEQSFFALEPELPNSNFDAQVLDSENQASDHNKVLVKPEEAETHKVNEVPINPGEPQILEAFEEIPAVIAEVEEPAGQSFDEALKEEYEIPKEQSKPEEAQEAAVEKILTSEVQQEPQEATPVQETELTEEHIPGSLEPQDTAEEIQTPEENQEHQEPDALEENIPRVEEAQMGENPEIAAESEAVEGSQEPETVAEDTEITEDSAVPADIPAIQENETAIEENQAPAEEAPLSEETEMSVNSEAIFKEPAVEEELLPAVESDLAQEPEVSQEIQTPDGNESQVAESSLDHEMIPVAEQEEISAFAPEEPGLIKSDSEQEAPAEIPLPEEPEENKSETDAKPEETPGPFAEPAIFEENSEEAGGIVPEQTVEEMEEEKPADAPESMPATEEMSQQDPIVQQMFEETADDNMKQTIGGFKPVDPEMAAEAEQLIADFINTLRKNEFVNEKPGMPMHVSMMAENVSGSAEGAVGTVEEAAKETVPEVQENQGQSEEVKQEESEELSSQPQMSVEENKSEESEYVKPLQEESKPEKLPTAEEESDIIDSDIDKDQENQSVNNLMPLESYQIPVQVITDPLEEIPQHGTAGIKPLSIDDIVELVKERLDQMPKDKMETPMQLDQVLSEAKPNENSVPQADGEQAAEEEIVMPIYHRTADVPHENVPVPDEAASVADAVDAVPIIPLEKISRFYRLHSKLSPKKEVRKRRFLFRSDES